MPVAAATSCLSLTTLLLSFLPVSPSGQSPALLLPLRADFFFVSVLGNDASVIKFHISHKISMISCKNCLHEFQVKRKEQRINSVLLFTEQDSKRQGKKSAILNHNCNKLIFSLHIFICLIYQCIRLN